MQSVKASFVKNKFGEVLDSALQAPVLIEKHGRTSAVLMAYKEYQLLKAAADALLAMRADEIVAKDDWLGPEKSETLLAEMISADT